MSKQIGLVQMGVTVLAGAAFVASWSSGFLIAAFVTVDTPATTLLVWRFVPVAVVLVATVLATGAVKDIRRSDLGHQAAVGLFAQFGYCLFVYAAIASGVASGTTALVDAVQPLVVATLVGPLLGLRVRSAQWVLSSSCDRNWEMPVRTLWRTPSRLSPWSRSSLPHSSIDVQRPGFRFS